MIDQKNINPRELQIAIDDNPTAASSTLTSNNTNATAGKKVVIGTTEYTFVAALTGAANEVLIGADADATMNNLKTLINSGRAAVAASAVLTSDNTNVSNADQVVIGAKTYVFKTALTEVKASGTLTSDNTNPADGDTVTVAGVTYTFRTVLKPRFDWVANEVLIGATADATLGNLKAAINGEAGAQTKYSQGTVAHPLVTCGSVSSHAVVVTAKSPGTAGNAYASTEVSAHLSWGGATLANGANSVANEVKIGADADTSLANLKAAINGGVGAGTTYSTATVASTQVLAGTLAEHALTITALTAGTAGNAFTSTETSAHLSFAGTTFTGGVAATAAHATVTAGTLASHALPMTAKTAGAAGNAIATTTDETTLSWTGVTLAGGGSTIGTATIGEEGGIIRNIVTKAPQWAGTPTYTVSILDADGTVLYVSGNLTENATTRTAIEIQVDPTDIIKITTSAVVEETLPVNVWLR